MPTCKEYLPHDSRCQNCSETGMEDCFKYYPGALAAKQREEKVKKIAHELILAHDMLVLINDCKVLGCDCAVCLMAKEIIK